MSAAEALSPEEIHEAVYAMGRQARMLHDVSQGRFPPAATAARR